MKTLVAALAIVIISGVALPARPAVAQSDGQALQRMVASERAFAAATAEVGVRDGFLAFFAEDSVQIQRTESGVTLGKARDGLASQALQQLPIANQLLWEPFTGQVSNDGSMGWLTGAYVRFNQAQKTTVGQGAYFSVWKRQANGTWRVWLDEGIQLPQIWQHASPFRVAPDPDTGSAGSPNEPVADAERVALADRPSWEGRLGAGVRLHRNGAMPFVGREAVVAAVASQPARAACSPVHTESAPSGDLAVVIGSCQTSGKTHGSYVRVWKRDVTARWRIVFQTETN